MKIQISFRQLAVAAAFLTIVSVQTLEAQQAAIPTTTAHAVASAAPAQAQPPAEQSNREPVKNGDQGVKIHGHWKIDVKNPDGTSVKAVEFENSLVTPNEGDVALGQMLYGSFAVGGWLLEAEDLDSNGNLVQTALCPGQGYYQDISACEIVYQTSGQTPPNGNVVANYACYSMSCFSGLTDTYVPYNSTTKAAAYFQLQGTMTPTAAGNITTVATEVVGCAQTSGTTAYTPAQCYLFANPPAPPAGVIIESQTFTQATLPTPLAVAAGQVITITVTISFS